jgi:DNA-binding CsgD family transcriptional regulator
MRPSQPNILVFSQSVLMGDLLAEFVRGVFGAQARSLCSLEQCLTPPAPNVLVCDTTGLNEAHLEADLARIAAHAPRLQFVRVDAATAANELTAALCAACGPFEMAHEKLTPHESEVLRGVAAGLRSADIARRTRRSIKTVEKHRANLQRKLGIRSVAQLTAYAIRHGLLSLDGVLPPRRD